MNIMLASVTAADPRDRDTEAVRATRREILGQFLIEAVVMSGVGGVIGILAGICSDLRLRGSRDGRWCFRCRPS